MKKLVSTMFMCLMAVTFMISCSDNNTPAAVAEKAAKCLSNKDYNGLAQLVDLPDEDKAELVSLIEEKASDELEAKGGISSYEILSTDVDEANGTATVTMNYTYGNGSKEEEHLNLVKSDSGDWKLSMDK